MKTEGEARMPESRAHTARELMAKPESRARSARKLRAKPESRAKPETRVAEGFGEGARKPLPRKFLQNQFWNDATWWILYIEIAWSCNSLKAGLDGNKIIQWEVWWLSSELWALQIALTQFSSMGQQQRREGKIIRGIKAATGKH